MKKNSFLKIAVFLLCSVLLLCFGGNILLRSVYPLKYEEEILKASEETGLSPALLFAVIKTESDFEADAVSHADARGLMQMIPETFQWIQLQTDGVLLYEQGALSNPQVNIHYGSLLLAFLINRYGSVETALCAYNAGVGTVDGWLQNEDYSDGESVQNIPYGETRRYVKRIAFARSVYEKLYDLP